MIDQAVILSAGLGTRMGNLTRLQPKPMLKYKGKPLIEHQILWLKKWGINRFYINLFYLPAKIIDYLGNGNSLGVEIIYNVEEILMGTGGAFLAFQPYLKNNFIAINCDIIIDVNLADMVQLHDENKHPATMAVYLGKRKNYSLVVVKENRVIDIAGRVNGSGQEGIFTGLQIISPEIFDYLPSGPSSVINDFYIPLLQANRPISAFTDVNEWIDMGTEQLFRKYLNQ